MRPGISSNASEIADLWRKRSVASDRGQRAASREIAPVMQREAQNELRTRVYAVAIPVRKSGKRAWNRTGDLIAHEKAVADGVDVLMTNDSDHAVARETLGTSQGRRIRSPGVQSVQWQRAALLKRRSWILQVRALHQRRALAQR